MVMHKTVTKSKPRNESQDEFNDEPLAIHRLLNDLNQTGNSAYAGVLYGVTCRLPPHLFGVVEALTVRAGTSRNKLVSQLIEVGIETALAALPDQDVSDIKSSGAEIVARSTDKTESGVL